MEPNTTTLRIGDELDDLRDRVRSLEDDQEDIIEDAERIDPPETEDEQEEFHRLEQETQEIQAELATVKGYISILEEARQEWNGEEITVKELSGQESRMLNDKIQRHMVKVAMREGMEVEDLPYHEGMHDVEFLKKTVESTPPGAPGPDDIEQLPNRLFEWLLGRANAFNTTGELRMGNSSLRELMMDTDGDDSLKG